jgi:hypothetical protein
MASTIGILKNVSVPVRRILPTVSIPYLGYIIVILAVNAALALFIFLMKERIPPTVPLFYGRPRGVEQLAPQLFLLLPPGLSIVVTLLNVVIMAITSDKFIKKVLIGIAFAATLLSAITVIKIILLVGSI